MGFADGHLFIIKKKDLIIIAGKNYYPRTSSESCARTGIYPRLVALDGRFSDRNTRLIVLAEVQEKSMVDDPGLGAEVRKTLAGNSTV
jgi:hypothetical protein